METSAASVGYDFNLLVCSRSAWFTRHRNSCGKGLGSALSMPTNRADLGYFADFSPAARSERDAMFGGLARSCVEGVEIGKILVGIWVCGLSSSIVVSMEVVESPAGF